MAVNVKRLAVLAAAGVGIWWALQIRRQAAGESQNTNGFYIPDVFGFIKTGLTNVGNAITDLSDMANSDFKTSITQGRGKAYFSAIENLSAQAGMPSYFLNRIAYQESRYREDAVNASSGAKGMFQFMPVAISQVKSLTGSGFDPLQWQAAAKGAVVYFGWLYKMFGNWQAAIAAYNWGPGNVQKHIKQYGRLNLAALPAETRDYVTGVSADLGWDY